MKKAIAAFCFVLTFVSCLPLSSNAYTLGDPWHIDLSSLIDDADNRRYAEMMLDFYLRNDTRIQKNLKEGYSAMFLFEGCSDNMDRPEMTDLSFYRVTASCFVIRLDEKREPALVYFNENCSTVPDRPLEYDATYKEGTGLVGPATICDGTYELFSVKHSGEYEALHMRDSLDDGEIPAVYMMPEGFLILDAEYINIHTRTSNHTSGLGMWSAGCMLIGDGGFHEFEEMMDSTYYTIYEEFEVGNRVGTVTINRANMAELLLNIYENPLAVETLLTDSRCILPEIYLQQCQLRPLESPRQLQTAMPVSLMSLPCSNETDARSVELAALEQGQVLSLEEEITNTRGGLWYRTRWNGGTAYVYGAYLEEVPEKPESWFTRFWKSLFG